MGTLRAIDVRTVLARLRERGAETQDADLQTTLDAARAAGAATAVIGDVVSTGETARLSAVLYDTGSGAVIRRLQVEGPEADFLALVDRLTIQAVEAAQSSETGGSPLPVPNLSALTTESLPALRAYLKAEDLNRRARNQEALPYIKQAVELDSTFAMAAYGLAVVTTSAQDATTDMVQEVQRRLRQAQRHGDRLPPREKSLLNSYVAYAIDGHAARSAEIVREGVGAYPTDPELWGTYGETLWAHPNIRPGALADGIEALRTAIQLDSSLAWAYVPVIRHQISTGDTTAARRLLAAYARQDPDTTASGMLRSLQGALDLAYGDSTAQARVRQQLSDGTYPRRGIYLREALAANPTPEALRAQTDMGMIWMSNQGLYGLRTMSLVFRGRYQDVRTFIRDTTATSRFARLARQQAASVLLERGALAASAVPDDLLRTTCEMDINVANRISGCYYEARIAVHREQAGLPGQAAVSNARSVLGRSIEELEAAGDGAFGTLATGFQSLISGMAALDQGDAEAPRSIQEAYEPLLLMRSFRDWEPMAESVRAQIRAGDAAAALPYAEMITAQDPYGHYLAGRAHEALGRIEAARTSYQQFVTAWRDADPDLPALQHAEAVLAEDPSAEAPPL
jgi:tetratricopeptide (TPR) repeat protein